MYVFIVKGVWEYGGSTDLAVCLTRTVANKIKRSVVRDMGKGRAYFDRVIIVKKRIEQVYQHYISYSQHRLNEHGV